MNDRNGEQMHAAAIEPGSLDPARVALGIRIHTLESSLQLGGGYLSQSCSSAEILATLYTRLMRLGTLGCAGPAAPVFGRAIGSQPRSL